MVRGRVDRTWVDLESFLFFSSKGVKGDGKVLKGIKRDEKV